MTQNYAGYMPEKEDITASECTNQDANRNDFSLFTKSSIDSDKSTIDIDITQSRASFNYLVDNPYGCDCGLEKARDIQLSQPVINFQGGKGWIGEKGCLIDKDSELRQKDDKLTDQRYINQLIERPHLTTGNLVKGYYDVDVESVIQPGNFTYDDKSCNLLSGITIGNIFTPMIPELRTEIQDTKHIIPEESMDDWVRFGLPTREIARNEDYMRRCKEKS